MKRSEVEQIVSLLNSMIDETGLEIDEVITPATMDVLEESYAWVEPDENKTKKMFRQAVPEGFDWAKVEVVRSPITGDRVFMKFGDEKRWIPDLETLEAMGHDLGTVKDISDEDMRGLKEKYGLLSAKLW